jgi:hypothetical protein
MFLNLFNSLFVMTASPVSLFFCCLRLFLALSLLLSSQPLAD